MFSCNFDKQIEKVISEAKSISGWILRTFETRESLPMLTLWKSLVIPCVEYCSQLWLPTKKGLIQDLEILQKNPLRKLIGFNKLNYWELLEKL